LERTIKFYRDVLGLEEIKRHQIAGGSELGFLKATGKRRADRNHVFPAGPGAGATDSRIWLEVDNLEWNSGKHLAKHGLNISDGPTTTFHRHGLRFIMTRGRL